MEANTAEETIILLDELAANAWPAPVQLQLEGWRMRAASGVTRRANSVSTSGPMPQYEQWQGLVSDFYYSRDLPTRYQVSAATPSELNSLLDNLGYTHEAETEVQVADLAIVMNRIELADKPGELTITSEDSLREDWLDAFMLLEEHMADKRAMYRNIMSRIGPRSQFVRGTWNGELVAIGTAVCERGWAGLFNLATAEQMRGRGIGSQVIGSLAGWAEGLGASKLYLQVMSSNEVAKRLYAKLGFSYLYGYHYRTEPTTK